MVGILSFEYLAKPHNMKDTGDEKKDSALKKKRP